MKKNKSQIDRFVTFAKVDNFPQGNKSTKEELEGVLCILWKYNVMLLRIVEIWWTEG